MNEWIRARSGEQKEERADAIVRAAARLFDRLPAEEITLTLIAKEADFTRSNIYKYFETKEDILMELLKSDMAAYSRGMTAHFREMDNLSVAGFADEWVKVQKRYPRFTRLLSILHSFLETNASIQSIIDFKRQALEEYQRLAVILSRTFPSFTQEQAVRFFTMQAAALTGISQQANEPAKVKKMLEMPQFGALRVNHEFLYRQSVEYILRGILSEGER